MAAGPGTIEIPASVNGGVGYEIDQEYLAEWAAAGVTSDQNTGLLQQGLVIGGVVLAVVALIAAVTGGKEEAPAPVAVKVEEPTPEPEEAPAAKEAAAAPAAEPAVAEKVAAVDAAEGEAPKAAPEAEPSDAKVKEPVTASKAKKTVTIGK